MELFFKWIKQHPKIGIFFGTSSNAVKTQIWIAVSLYLLAAIIKKTEFKDEPVYFFTNFECNGIRESL